MAKAMMERLRIDGFDVKVVKHNIHGEDDTPCQLVIISPPAATQTLMLSLGLLRARIELWPGQG